MSPPRVTVAPSDDPAGRQRLPVLGVPIDVLPAAAAVDRLLQWAARRESRMVCLCNVHAVIMAGRDAGMHEALANADLALPDGAPVAFMLRRLGAKGQRRIAGPDLMDATLARAAASGMPVFLYGGTPATLERLQQVLRRRWPALKLAGALSPPFRAPTAAEIAADVDAINRSGAGLVWVGLGCPKQERWMADRRGQVRAVMVGVGAAFDFIAGTVPRAPSWMRSLGLEWLHRLAVEPRRLARRYLVTNTLFVLGATRQWLRGR
jgi:N-acetylglucosaminyldiphosphoundecaprenol N-acetyl-beta-D-mannosaminyltransferase